MLFHAGNWVLNGRERQNYPHVISGLLLFVSVLLSCAPAVDERALKTSAESVFMRGFLVILLYGSTLVPFVARV